MRLLRTNGSRRPESWASRIPHCCHGFLSDQPDCARQPADGELSANAKARRGRQLLQSECRWRSYPARAAALRTQVPAARFIPDITGSKRACLTGSWCSSSDNDEARYVETWTTTPNVPRAIYADPGLRFCASCAHKCDEEGGVWRAMLFTPSRQPAARAENDRCRSPCRACDGTRIPTV